MVLLIFNSKDNDWKNFLMFSVYLQPIGTYSKQKQILQYDFWDLYTLTLNIPKKRSRNAQKPFNIVSQKRQMQYLFVLFFIFIFNSVFNYCYALLILNLFETMSLLNKISETCLLLTSGKLFYPDGSYQGMTQYFNPYAYLFIILYGKVFSKRSQLFLI